MASLPLSDYVSYGPDEHDDALLQHRQTQTHHKLSWWCNARNPLMYLSVILFVAVVALSVVLITHKPTTPPSTPPSNGPKPPPPVAPQSQFFQLTDIHLDPYYSETIGCNNFCRNVTMPPYTTSCGKTGVTRAGFVAPYGRYGCDSPKALLDSALATMVQVNPTPAFIMITGDMAAHSLCTSGPGTPPSNCGKDSQNHTNVVTAIKTVIAAVGAVFPNTPILPMFGNNDTPEHYITPLGADHIEYMNTIKSIWTPVITCASCSKQVVANLTQFDVAGYYSVSEVIPGTRILALNSLLFGSGLDQRYIADAGGVAAQDQAAKEHLAWIDSELAAAAVAGQQVILASHIPPGMQPYNGKANWNATYQVPFFEILAKHSAAVSIQLYGHFHFDTFRVFPLAANAGSACAVNEALVSAAQANSYVSDTQRTTTLLAPGMSPIFFNNPSFRLYQMDMQAKQIVDYQQYWLDLQKANFAPTQPTWELEYTFSQLYNRTLSADNLCSLATSMGTDSRLWAAYSSARAMQYFPFRYKYMCAMTTLSATAYDECIAQTANFGSGDYWPM